MLMFNNISKYSWFCFVPMIFIGLLTLVLLLFSVIPIWYLFFTLIGWVLISGLGIAVGYHRIFSHNTHKDLPKWKENVILFLGILGGQGSSLTWTAIHRGYHHKYTDTLADLHSPIHGKWYAFFTWTTKIKQTSVGFNMKYAGNLLRRKNHVWFHNNQMKILWGVPLIIAIYDWKLSLMAICLPSAMSLFQENLINVLGHIKWFAGYRNFNTNDNSHNSLILGYLCWGQGWHNNHHFDPKSFDFGKSVSKKWWEYDPCNLFLPFLK